LSWHAEGVVICLLLGDATFQENLVDGSGSFSRITPATSTESCGALIPIDHEHFIIRGIRPLFLLDFAVVQVDSSQPEILA
jgi:hypothetical protein